MRLGGDFLWVLIDFLDVSFFGNLITNAPKAVIIGILFIICHCLRSFGGILIKSLDYIRPVKLLS